MAPQSQAEREATRATGGGPDGTPAMTEGVECYDFALSPAGSGDAGDGGGCNPQEMTPPPKDSTVVAAPIGKHKVNQILEAEYGEVSLDEDDFDENDVELGESSSWEDGDDEDDENSLVAESPDGFATPTKPGLASSPSNPASACGHCTSEEATASATVAFWLLFWLANNIGLTLLNKATFAKYDFKYPFFLSFFHMACNYLGGEVTLILAARRRESSLEQTEKGEYAPVSSGEASDVEEGGGGGSAAKKRRQLRRTKSLVLDGLHHASLNRSGSLKMWAFSVIFSLNIAIGNVSLRYVSVNFNQVMRSLVPAVAIAFGLCLGKKTSRNRVLAVVPVVGGVAMACYGEMELTVIGFVFTGLCVILAALKAVAAGEILAGELKLHPVDLLNKMAPKAAIQCLLLSYLTGELHSIVSRWEGDLSPITGDYHPALGVISTGILSFSLNISSLMSNKLTSPLTLCIAANVKQVLMIGMATVIFSTPISALNGGGIGVVLVGSAVYSWVSLKEKQKKGSAAPTATGRLKGQQRSSEDDDGGEGSEGGGSRTVRIAPGGGSAASDDEYENDNDKEEGKDYYGSEGEFSEDGGGDGGEGAALLMIAPSSSASSPARR